MPFQIGFVCADITKHFSLLPKNTEGFRNPVEIVMIPALPAPGVAEVRNQIEIIPRVCEVTVSAFTLPIYHLKTGTAIGDIGIVSRDGDTISVARCVNRSHEHR